MVQVISKEDLNHVHGNSRAPAPGVSNDDASLCSRVHSPMSLTFALQEGSGNHLHMLAP